MMRKSLIVLTALACVLPSGCVRRRMTIRSNPPGATVYVDDQEIGTTPVSAAYTYYGTRKIQLVKDGYETITQLHEFSTPWYEYPPLDFISENLVPMKIRDERIVEFDMEPQQVVPTTELLARAGQLRETTRAGYTVPTPPTVGHHGHFHDKLLRGRDSLFHHHQKDPSVQEPFYPPTTSPTAPPPTYPPAFTPGAPATAPPAYSPQSPSTYPPGYSPANPPAYPPPFYTGQKPTDR